MKAPETGTGREAATLGPPVGAVLETLCRLPLASARDLGLLLDGRDPSGVRRCLTVLEEKGCVEHVVPSSACLTAQRLFYPTTRGIGQAARRASTPVGVFARRQGLGERALLRRLGRLDHLVLSRGLLLDLLAGLRGRNDVTLAAWDCWPLRWPGATLGGRRDLLLDGAGVLALGGRGEDHEGWASFVLLWDDAQVAIEALRPRLRALLQVGSRRAVLAADPAGVPAVLCAVAGAGRTREVHRLARDLARGLDVPPLTLLTADQRDLITSGPLGVLWCGADGRERDLLVALPRQHVPCPGVLALAALRAHPRHAHPLVGVTTGPRRGTGGMAQEEPPGRRQILVRGRFTARAAALDGAGQRKTAGEHVGIMGLALSPGALRVLRQIGVTPLLQAGQLAEVVGDSVLRLPRTLGSLQRLDLIEGTAQAPRGALCRRYVLTPGGLRVLAARAGLAPQDYLRATGSIAGTVGDHALGESPGPGKAQGGARSPGDTGNRTRARHSRCLIWMLRYPAHTAALQGVFLQFVRAARACSGVHALEAWQGEWACSRRYTDDGRWVTLRPDALGRYRAGESVLSLFLEVDRGTYGARRLRHKLAAYCAYRASGAWTRALAIFPTVLVVTTGEGRLRTVLRLAEEVAEDTLTGPLPLLAATAADLATQGPLGPIWRERATTPPHSLFPDREQATPEVPRATLPPSDTDSTFLRRTLL